MGRAPLHCLICGGASRFTLAETGGVEAITLNSNQIPAHTHTALAAHAQGDQATPLGNVPANSFAVTPYINDVSTGNFNAAAIGLTGGSQPHNNFQPYLCVDFIISLFGIFPSQT
jgi:microcystin-dependent protein